MTDILDLIDGAVDDWETSGDAMRWAPRPVDVVQLMDPICAWLTANGIAPSDVPIEAVPVVQDRTITCPVYLRRDGKLYMTDDGDVARGTTSVPLVADPPEVLTDWLAGNVPVRAAPSTPPEPLTSAGPRTCTIKVTVRVDQFVRALSACATAILEAGRAIVEAERRRARLRRIHTEYRRRCRARARRARSRR